VLDASACDPREVLVAVARDARRLGVHAPGDLDKDGKSQTWDWRYEPGLSENTAGVRADYQVITLAQALVKQWPTDAHFVGYIVYLNGNPLPYQPRVTKESLAWFYANGFEIYQTCLIGDWDNPGHIKWKDAPLQLRIDVDELLYRNPWLADVGNYVTNAGYRVLQPLELPIPVFCVESTIYQWTKEGIDAGILLDLKCKDWTHHFRLACVVRETRGKKEKISVLSDLENMKFRNLDTWARVPRFPPDTLKQFGEHGLTHIELAVKKYGFDSTTQRIPGTQREPRPIGTWVTEVPDVYKPLCQRLGEAARVIPLGDRHKFSLHLSGALLHRGVPPEALAPIVESIASIGGHHASHHAVNAQNTAVQFANGRAVSGLPQLTLLAPDFASILQASLQTPGETRVQDQVDAIAALSAQAVSLEEAREAMFNEIRFCRPGITFITSEPGTGKTYLTIKVAADLKHSADAIYGDKKVPSNYKVVILSDKNSLAIQTYGILRDEYDVPVKRLFGPASLRDKDGKLVCHYAEATQHIASSGMSVSKIACQGLGRAPCKYLPTCIAAKGWEGDEDASVVTTSHAKGADAVGLAGKKALTVTDESPSVIHNHTLSVLDFDYALSHASSFNSKYITMMLPLLHMMRGWLKKNQPGTTDFSILDIAKEAGWCVPSKELYDALISGGIETEHTAGMDAISCAQGALPQDTKNISPPLRLQEVDRVREVANYSHEVMRAAFVYRSLYETAQSTNAAKPAILRVEEHKDVKFLRIVCPNHVYRLILQTQHKNIILDATAEIQIHAVKALTGMTPTERRFIVVDGCPDIRRHALVYRTALRSIWLSPFSLPLWTNGILRAIKQGLALVGPVESLCFISFLPIVVAMRFVVNPKNEENIAFWGSKGLKLPHVALEESAELLAPVMAGHQGEWVLPHYGGTRGLNVAMHVGGLITAGDPYPNVDSVQLHAKYMNLPVNNYVKLHAQAELVQAHGRLRAPQRKTPATVVHIGAILPPAYGWDRAHRSMGAARFQESIAPMSGLELSTIRKSLGITVEQMYDKLCVSARFVRMCENGERNIPHGIAMFMRDWSEVSGLYGHDE
jgi:hypothetical protein